MTTHRTTAPTPTSKRLIHIGLWLLQAVLAALFLATGLAKLLLPIAQLSAMMPWATSMPDLVVRFIGLAEVAGALGLLLPSITRVRPNLTPLSALGLLTVMILAMVLHLSRSEGMMIGVTFTLAVLVCVVAWGRSAVAPIAPRR